MPKRSHEDARLTRLTQIALSLPATQRQCHGEHAAFLVRKKTFAYFLNNHHGDGIVAVTCKALPGDNTALVAAQPTVFTFPHSSGREVGSRFALTSAKWIGTRPAN